MRRPGNRLPVAIACVVALLAAGILVVTLGGDQDDPPSRVSGDEYFGVNAPFLRAYTTPELEDSLDALSATMGEQGIGWARIVIGQAVEQPVPGPVDWSIPDEVVAALARNGVRADAVFVGTAPWTAAPGDAAACGQRARPNDVGAWARFIGGAAERYGSRGAFWDENPELDRLPIEVFEIGNEVNLRSFWCPAVDPEGYAAVYRSARDAVLHADPKAQVVVGGLAAAFETAPEGDLTVPEFLRRMVDAEPALSREIPAVGAHPYAETPAGVLAGVRRFREAMDAAGLSRASILVNEIGWYTSGPPGIPLASEDERAAYIGELAAVIDETSCDVSGFGVHAWFTAEQDPGNPEDWYGIADPRSGEPREGAIAFGEAIAGERSEGADDLGADATTLCD